MNFCDINSCSCFHVAFQVFIRLTSDTDEPSPKDAGLRTNFTLSILEPYTLYNVTVQAFTGAGGGEKSDVQVMTDESGEPQGMGWERREGKERGGQSSFFQE